MEKRSKSKKIVIISLNYYPEETAIGLYSTQMAEYLNNEGWDVTVISGFPYYPNWKISEDYKKKYLFYSEKINGIKVLRYKQFVPKKPNFLNRIIHIIDFTIGSFLNLKNIKEVDIVLSIIPFTSSAWLGKKLSKKFNAKHWIHIQDFEFDIALESGISSSNKLFRFLPNNLFKIEKKILNSADIASSISYGMIEKLKSKSTNKIFYFPNWIDNDSIDPLKANQHSYISNNKFSILYSGNIGAKQDWNLFLKVVDYFKKNNQIEFIVVGNGSFKNKLIEQTKEFKNVKHHDSVPLIELNNLLCSVSLHILFQKKNVLNTVMPSKVLGMMASEVPSLITGNSNSEIAEMIKSKEIGYFYESSDLSSIFNKIEEIFNDKSKRKFDGKKARRYVIETFSKKTILKKFNDKLTVINEG